MKSNDTPAFPVTDNLRQDMIKRFGSDKFAETVSPDATITYQGMTLRDYFAAKAMQGIYSNPEACNAIARFGKSKEGSPFELDPPFEEQVSALAYRRADAMLAEREKETQ